MLSMASDVAFCSLLHDFARDLIEFLDPFSSAAGLGWAQQARGCRSLLLFLLLAGDHQTFPARFRFSHGCGRPSRAAARRPARRGRRARNRSTCRSRWPRRRFGLLGLLLDRPRRPAEPDQAVLQERHRRLHGAGRQAGEVRAVRIEFDARSRRREPADHWRRRWPYS